MTRIDFYLLDDGRAEAELLFACRLADKALRQGSRLHFHCADEARLARLDELLWTFRNASFIPHERADAPLPHCPVTLGSGPFDGHDEVLVSLAPEVPEFFSQFPRVVEIVDRRGPTVETGRRRYRFYRERGYKVRTHDIPPPQARP